MKVLITGGAGFIGSNTEMENRQEIMFMWVMQLRQT